MLIKCHYDRHLGSSSSTARSQPENQQHPPDDNRLDLRDDDTDALSLVRWTSAGFRASDAAGRELGLLLVVEAAVCTATPTDL